jgi:DNA-binding transcriptional ArsR family regulator
MSELPGPVQGARLRVPAQDDPAIGAVFAALADPTRRHVVELLSERPTVTASGLADELPISRQAIAKHLGALTAAGLLTRAHEGRETQYSLSPQPLGGAMRWMAAAGARWDEGLARLRDDLGMAPDPASPDEPQG